MVPRKSQFFTFALKEVTYAYVMTMSLAIKRRSSLSHTGPKRRFQYLTHKQ